ncbi:Inositol-trisphosphate 3-kinase A [Dirofilaria immitis]|nr:Inositol-trisphosphate 3-kinase A [Dirofilaria immitis]
MLQNNTTVEIYKWSTNTMAITALPLDCWLKERLRKWVQLSGHEGTIVPATEKTLWKRRSCSDYNEGNAYRALMNDPSLQTFIPRYYREINYENDYFIEIEDLTSLFDDPAIMDIKMGTRTFSESEVNSTIVRNDLYEKMVSLDPYEPTEEEHFAKAITKARYMQFRENKSSSATLGYRIEGAKYNSTAGFHILCRLKELREAVQKSLFFRTHEVIGSSLLLMYDATYANVWMIDFAKSIPVEIDSINHRREWVLLIMKMDIL